MLVDGISKLRNPASRVRTAPRMLKEINVAGAIKTSHHFDDREVWGRCLANAALQLAYMYRPIQPT